MTLPLTERYRPKSIADILGNETIVARLQGYVDGFHKGAADQPNLLFTGPPGVGKTSAATALCRDLFGDAWRTYTLELNASDERGIDVIRGRVKDFARATALGQPFNVIILDEVDNLTRDAQAALRRTMEDYQKSCRFILCCNYPNRIIAPVRDRCAIYTFAPIPAAVGTTALRQVCTMEGIQATDAALARLWETSKGSMRAALTKLQALPATFTEADIPAAHGRAAGLMALVGQGKVREAETALLEWMRRDGAGSDEVFSELFDTIADSGLPDGAKTRILLQLGDTEYRVTGVGCNPEIQGRCFIRYLASLSKKEESK